MCFRVLGRIALTVWLMMPAAGGAVTSLDPIWGEILSVADALSLASGDGPAKRPSSWVSVDCAGPSPHRARASALRQDAKASAADLGLDLDAGVAQGLSGSQSGERNLYVGLAWNLLGDGYRANRRRATQLERRANVAELAARADVRRRNARCRTEALANRLTGPRRRLLERWGAFLDTIVPAVRRAYLDGRGLLDRVLQLEADRRLVRRQVAALASAELARGTRVPVPFALDFEAIRSAVRTDPLRRQRLALRTRVLREEAAIDATNRRRLSTYLRYQVDDEDRTTRGLVAGVRYSMPLFGDSRDGAGARIRAERRETRNDMHDRLLTLERLQAEFEEQERRVVRQHYRYLHALERLRRSVAAYRVHGATAADPATAMLRANSALAAGNERLLAIQALYRKAGRVFEAAGLPPAVRFRRALELPAPNYRGRDGHRALYVWSRTLGRLGSRVLVELARARGIARLVVSTGPPEAGGADALPITLVEAGRRAGIVLERLIGANAWARPRNHADAFARVARMELPSGGLHLDVEPQALGDTPGTRPEDLTGYLRLVEGIHERLDPGTPLNVSVPATWRPATYRRLADRVDRLYVMAYPSDAARAIARRVQPVLEAVAARRLVIVLRVADVETGSRLQELITSLRAATGVTRFALHDAGGLVRLNGSAVR